MASKTFSDILGAWRDVEVAKRSQPKLVQGAQHATTPIAYNSPTNETRGGVAKGSPLLLLGGGLALLLGAVLIIKKKRG